MTQRERLSAALQHQDPGQIPMDFGGTAVTGMHVTCVAALRDHYGLETRPVRLWEPYQMLGAVDDDLMDAMEADVVGVVPPKTMFGFPLDDWSEWTAPWGQELIVPGGFAPTAASDGGLHLYPEGDTSVSPSGHMPEGGFFFDAIIRQEPISDDQLDPADNLEEFGPISDEDLAYFAREARRARASGRGVIATFGGTAFGDIALVPAPFLKQPKGIRDVTEWYISTITRQDYLHAVFARQCEIALANLAKLHEGVQDNVDAVFICGTDFGTQTGTFCSPDAFESLYAPYYRQINDWVHANTTWKTFKHSCGAVESFMQRFIDAGFDIINPVQCSATGMDARELKDNYGDRLVFWGGGVDTQHTLPYGTPEDVRSQVLERCEIFARDGGFVFDAIHNVQAKTPVANIVAMIDAVNEFRG